MIDFQQMVRERLRDIGLSPVREAEIVDEVAQHLRDGGGRAKRNPLAHAKRLPPNEPRPGFGRLMSELPPLRDAL